MGASTSSFRATSGRDRLDGSGRLKTSDQHREGPRASVHLAFERLAGQPDRLGVSMSALRQDSGAVWLFFFYLGDQGNQWTAYEKCSAPCPSPSPPWPSVSTTKSGSGR
jgi:hypothetical protein